MVYGLFGSTSMLDIRLRNIKGNTANILHSVNSFYQKRPKGAPMTAIPMSIILMMSMIACFKVHYAMRKIVEPKDIGLNK